MGKDGEEGEEGCVASRLIARAGLCTRRQADQLAREGRVSVNGEVLTDFSRKLDLRRDSVTVDGKVLPASQPTKVWKLFKPKEVLTQMTADGEGRATVRDLLDGLGMTGQVRCVGRLDYYTEGLLLLTNDGGLKRALELPASGFEREYRVRVRGAVGPEEIRALESGVVVEGVRYQGMRVVADDPRKGGVGANQWVTVTVREGKNKEVRNAMLAVGCVVSRLIRVRYGPVRLGDLPAGGVQPLPREEAVALGDMTREMMVAPASETRTAFRKREAPPRGGRVAAM